MEKEATTSSGLYEGRGAGGKLRKHVRKPPATPYDRPANQAIQFQTAQRRDGGWLSKLVNPASRILSSGATRLLPSFFSKPAVIAPPVASEAEDPEVRQDAGKEDPKYTSDIQTSRSKEGGPGEEVNGSNCVSEIDEHAREKSGNSSDDSGLSEIEQLMKGKTFSRDELNRLVEVLHSRAVDLSDVDGRGKKNLNMTAGREAASDGLGHKEIRKLVQEKQADHLNRVTGRISNPILQPTIRDEVGASPIEIAKAYMGGRASELGLSSQSMILRDERAPLHSDDFVSKRLSIPPPSPNSSLYRPGATVQDMCGYLTPQTQGGRFGIHNLPRTPYSRSAYPKTTSKLTPFQGGGDRSVDILSTYGKQSQSPVYADVQVKKTRGAMLDGSRGSVGPTRRMSQNFFSTTPSRGAGLSRPVSSEPLWTEVSDASRGFLPTVKKNLEPGASTSSTPTFPHVDIKASSFTAGVSTVHPQSSELARKILEHLDRTVPTPKEKSAELKLATAWKKPPSEFTTGMANEQFGRPHVEGSDSQKNSYLLGGKFSAQGNEDRGSSFLFQPEQNKTNETMYLVNEKTLDSNTVFGVVGSGYDGMEFNTVPCTVSKKIHHSQANTHEVSIGFGDSRHGEKQQPLPFHNQIDGQDVPGLVHAVAVSEGLNVQRKPPTHSSGSKLGLTHISIDKPNMKRAVSLDNGSGFTFPVSASPGELSEPPTPSIMPSFSASSLTQPNEGNAVPTYSFGTKKRSDVSDQILVFSFPSSNTGHDYASTPKFNFGSDKKKSEVSIRFGKDAMCF